MELCIFLDVSGIIRSSAK